MQAIGRGLPNFEELDDAIASAEELLEHEPDNTAIRLDLAGFYRTKGAHGLALRLLKQAGPFKDDAQEAHAKHLTALTAVDIYPPDPILAERSYHRAIALGQAPDHALELHIHRAKQLAGHWLIQRPKPRRLLPHPFARSWGRLRTVVFRRLIAPSFYRSLRQRVERERAVRYDGFLITGSEEFSRKVVEALQILHDGSPGSYQLVKRHVGRFVEGFPCAQAGVLPFLNWCFIDTEGRHLEIHPSNIQWAALIMHEVGHLRFIHRFGFPAAWAGAPDLDEYLAEKALQRTARRLQAPEWLQDALSHHLTIRWWTWTWRLRYVLQLLRRWRCVERYYHDNGVLACEMRYKNMQLHGVSRWYYPNGRVRTEVTYNKGTMEGVRKDCYEAGGIESEYVYKNGKADGLARQYYENGNLKAGTTFKDELQHGPMRMFYEDGTLSVESGYREGKPHGWTRRYDQSGRLYWEGRFENGTLIEERNHTPAQQEG